jgi:hypothetical protein
VVPSFYDSIELARDRMRAKYLRREARWPALVAFGATLLEALATLVGLRLVFRLVRGLARSATARLKPAGH